MSNTRPPGVRRGVWLQSAADTSREKEDKGKQSLEAERGQRGGASGEVARAVKMAYAIRYAKVGLGHKRVEGS
jgi:hypothetical protein